MLAIGLVLSFVIVAPGVPSKDACVVAKAEPNLGTHQLPPIVVTHIGSYRDAWRKFCAGAKAQTLEDLFGRAVALEDELHSLPLAILTGGESPGDFGQVHRFADGGAAAVASIPGFRRGLAHSDLDIDLPEFSRVAARIGGTDARFFQGCSGIRESRAPPHGDFDLFPNRVVASSGRSAMSGRQITAAARLHRASQSFGC